MDAELNGKVFGHLDLDSAVCMLQGGCSFGDVFPCVDPADRDELRRVFVTDSSCGPMPPNQHRHQLEASAPKPPATFAPTGHLCGKCGGHLVRDGSCTKCTVCGDSSGGCGG